MELQTLEEIQDDLEIIVNDEAIEKMESWLDSCIDRMIPDKITVDLPSRWAENKRIIPEGLSSIPGAYSWNINPYMKDIIDLLHPSSPIQFIDIMKGVQITYSVGLLENNIGWIIDENPGPTLFVTGDKETAEKNMSLRIDRMIELAGMSHKIFSQSEKKNNKKTGNTNDVKEFPGGYLKAVGPNSGTKLRNDSIKNLLLDEIDAAQSELKNEGSWISNAENRTASFENTRKILAGSTPLLKETSRIYERFLKGTQEYYNVPCISCRKLFVLKFFKDDHGKGGLRFELDKDGNVDENSVRLHCPHCDHPHTNDDKSFLFEKSNGAEWVATAIPITKNRRSFHISSLYAPVGFMSWVAIAQKFHEAKNDKAKLQVFYNTILGEPWEDTVNAPPYEKIMVRRSGYSMGRLPQNFEPLLYTLGVDVQGDRIEAELVGWGRDKVSASILYEVIRGDTENIEDPCYSQLEDLIESLVDGQRINMTLVDSGYRTNQIYEFCSKYMGGVFPIMGSGSLSRRNIHFQRYPVKAYGIDRIDLNTDILKTEFYGYVQKSISDEGKIPFGYCYFPEDYTENHYKALLSEVRTLERDRNGTVRWKWDKIKDGRSNEQLDCRVYALGGLYVLAQDVCKAMGLESINWVDFWDWVESQKSPSD